jgi:DNA phosphorothioation-dependent restriction protein DptG
MDDLHKLFKNLRTASEILELVENHFDDDTDAQEAFSADIETIKSARAAVWEMWNNNSQFPDEFHEDLDNLSDDDLSKWYRAAFTFPIERVHDWRSIAINELMDFHSHATEDGWSDFIHKIDRCGLNQSYIHRLI